MNTQKETNTTMKSSIPILCVAVLFITARAADDCPEYECPAKDGSFADPCTCRRFYQCVDFLPVRSHCPSGLYWDDIKQVKVKLSYFSSQFKIYSENFAHTRMRQFVDLQPQRQHHQQRHLLQIWRRDVMKKTVNFLGVSALQMEPKSLETWRQKKLHRWFCSCLMEL